MKYWVSPECKHGMTLIKFSPVFARNDGSLKPGLKTTHMFVTVNYATYASKNCSLVADADG